MLFIFPFVGKGTVVKTIVRFVIAALCAFVFSTAQAQYGKLWWNPDPNGMGTPIEQQTRVSSGGVRQEIIFGVWFHYTQTSDPTWLAFSCGLVKDNLGRDGCADVLFQVKGSPPVGYDPTKFQATSVGTMQILFNSSASATFSYDFTLTGQSRQAGTLNWVPQIFAVDATAPQPLQVLPGTANVFSSEPSEFNISGGSGGYSLLSSNTVVVPTPTISASKFTVLATSVNVDTAVTVKVRDSAGTTVAVALVVKPNSTTTLSNTVTITPIAPSGTGCGGGLCGGGDARVVVTAVLSGIKLVNRPIRFDVSQGDFRFVTPGTNATILVTSLIINTDENGEAVARIQALVTARTQVATLTATDTVNGSVRPANFVVVQAISGTGILSTLPSGSVTFTGAQPLAGQPAQCPFGGVVDMYIYGGTPPYVVVSPLTQYLTVSPFVVTTNGGSFRVTQSGCGTASLIVTDAQNRVVQSSAVIGALGPSGDAVVSTPTALTVAPTTHTLLCGQTGTSTLSGSGIYTASLLTTGVPAGAFSVIGTTGTIPGTISFTRNNGIAAASPNTITVNLVAGTIAIPVTVTIPASCP